MSDHVSDGPVSKAALWTGRVLSAIPVLMLLMSATMKFVQPASMTADVEKMGWPLSYMRPLGVVELVCTLLYIFPKTAYLGAILLTGYLGGAIATHARLGDPKAAMVVVLGVLVWLGLYLRDRRLRRLAPLTTGE